MSDNPSGSQGGSGQDDPFAKPGGGSHDASGQPNAAQPPSSGQPAYGQNPSQPPYGQYGQNAPQPPYGQNPAQPPYGQYGQNAPQPAYGQYGQNQGQSPYGQPPYGQPAGYPAGGYNQAQRENPGRTLGIVGLILAFIPFLNPVGLILSIVALVKSKKAGMGNGIAVAGIVVGALATILLILLIVLIVTVAPLANDLAEFCQEAGPGPQVYNGQEVECPAFP